MITTNERGSGIYTAILKDETDEPVPASVLSTLTLTLWEEKSGTIINSRNAQNVLNTNNVTVSELGVITWAVQPADTACVRASSAKELFIALFRATWSGGHAWNWEYRFYVTNLTFVP